jgi:hypothetical protein
MDVQGAEIEVLSSFGEYLNKTKFIYTEYSGEELYENSADLKNILDLLGNNWEIVHDFGTDVLVKNKLFD